MSFYQVPEFTNVFTLRRNKSIICVVMSADSALIAKAEFEYEDYDSQPDLVADVTMWAIKHGGILKQTNSSE